ncbi:MAG TPA: hypothetical protein VNR36_08155 [Pseudolysinimonas sp.]|nr:hypothetical protein [Pseudolysinimonas sp.]
MILLSEEAARQALDEVGELQRQVEAEEVDFELAGDQIVERLDAVMTLFEGSANIYSVVAEPAMRWAHAALAPKWVVDQDATAESRRYKALWYKISEFFDRYKHLDPDA